MTRTRIKRQIPAILAYVWLLLVGAACASTQGSSTYGAAAWLDDGAIALTQGDFEAAREKLAEARERCGNTLLGRQALLLLGALELDPRNPQRSPDQAAEHTARYLRLSETYPWTRPLAESLYLLALELGASEPKLADTQVSTAELRAPACEEADRHAVQSATGELPTLDRPNMLTRLRALERNRAELQRQLTVLRNELDRVRMTVRP